ncbi:MAG: MurT ligase domain-containing protein [Candidatus Saccharimonadales bacterium]
MIGHKHVTRIGKLVRHASRLRGGTGSALPGLVVEKIDPLYAKRILESLPYGIVIVTGTNGKTTTTKILCQLLESTGMHVFTNKSGSNFTRGVIASLLAETNHKGELEADIAVLELDEAYAAQFVRTIRPRYSLLLNVMRDQLDRFGEIDHTAKLLQRVADATTEVVVLNSDDPLVSAIAETLPGSTKTIFYGVSSKLHDTFPSDHQLYGSTTKLPAHKQRTSHVTLENVQGNAAIFKLGTGKPHKIDLKLQGVYNMQNAAGALALAETIAGPDHYEDLLKALSDIRPAFGRGEAIELDGHPLEIVLVKNPAGFRLALQSYSHKNIDTMIAINDNYADGRDMSWLWDVSFRDVKQASMVSGTRAYDMALRLQYDDVVVQHVEPSLAKSMDIFLATRPSDKRIFCTYTAMMTIRKHLAKRHDLKDIDR